MNESGDLRTAQDKPAFEPSELVDHGDAAELTRASGAVGGGDAGGYTS